MSLQTWLAEWKLGRVERKLKRLHARQRQIRDRISRAESDAKDGGVTEADLEARIRKLEDEKHDVTERVNVLHAQESALRATLEAEREKEKASQT